MYKNVYFALWNLGRAGAERMVIELAKVLPHADYHPSIVAVGGGGPLEEEIRSAGIPLQIGPTGSRRLRARFCREMLRSLPRQTVLHTHLGADYWLGLPSRLFRRDCIWISTCHNDDRDESWLKQRLKVFAWNRAQKVICVSQQVANFWQERGLSKNRVCVIPNGIDPDQFFPRSAVSWPDIPRFLMIARLVEQKNHETVLRALANIHRPWRLEILGDGPLRARLEQLVEELGLGPRVQFQGVREDIHSWLEKANVFLMPSRWEGQGIALLEAAAAGVPAIVSDLPALRETFDETQLKFVPAEDVGAWHTAIEEILQHPTSASQRAFAAWQQVMKTRTISQMVDSYLKQYAHFAR